MQCVPLLQRAVDFTLLVHDRVGSPLHFHLKFVVHLVEAPLFVLDVLHPLEIAHRHTTRVGQDVRKYRDSTGEQDSVGRWCRRAIGCFDDELRSRSVSHVGTYLVFERRWNENVARQGQQFHVADSCRALHSGHGACASFVFKGTRSLGVCRAE